MKIKLSVTGSENIRDFQRLAKRLASGKWHAEVERGLVDAGRKVRTTVAKAVKDQGGFRTYGDVNPHVRGGLLGNLTYRIASARGGQRLEHYRGLRILKQKARDQEAGTVRSGVWNNPRTFPRSFATEAGTFALLPDGKGTSTVAPRALWTWGRKADQPRDEGGRFQARGIRYGGVERLMGPSVSKELVQDESLAKFHHEAPMQTSILVGKRLSKIIKY